MSNLSDSELVSLVRSSRAGAYRELVTRYQGHVYGLAYSIVGNWHDAQDIAQEAFIRAYTNLDQLRDPARFPAWLRRVSFSVALAWMKAFRPALYKGLNGRIDLDTLEIPDFAPGPAETAEKRELADAVLAAVASLPPKYRVPLTMFHLDGLSYRKVADFLDIPLGTAKSLITRARAKLRSALAASLSDEAAPVVQEVFNEHKLPPEFAARVLDGVPSLRWEKTECTFAGAVFACMQFLKEPYTYPYIMGVSGGAFRIYWCRKWCPSSGDLMLVGLEPAKRAFRALGYQWQWFGKNNTPGEKEHFREIVAESIDRGRPVLATGIIGPSEHGVVTGYDNDALVGWSFFQGTDDAYYRQTDWYESALDLLIVLGDKVAPLGEREVVRSALEWAVELASKGEFQAYGGSNYACGLNAYEEWAAALLRDEDFPAGDLEVLTFRCNVCTSVVLANLRDARAAAAEFLEEMASVCPAAAAEMAATAEEYRCEVRVVEQTLDRAPFCFAEEKRRLEMADRSLREFIAAKVLEARDCDARAVSRMKKALEIVA